MRKAWENSIQVSLNHGRQQVEGHLNGVEVRDQRETLMHITCIICSVAPRCGTYVLWRKLETLINTLIEKRCLGFDD